MSGWEIRLSADETAMAMAQAGNGELALQLLFAQTQAPLSADEASSRLTAASEALAARGLLTIEPGGSSHLEEPLNRVAPAIAAAELTLRLAKTTAGEDNDEAFHFLEGRIVRQRADGPSYVFTEEESLDAIVERAHQFFDAAATSEADEGVSLPASLLDELAQAPSADAARAIAAAVGGSGTLIEAFATDCQGATMRGSFSRIGYGHGHPVTQAGALIVGSAERVWLLGLDRQEAGNLRLTAATRVALQREIERLAAASHST